MLSLNLLKTSNEQNSTKHVKEHNNSHYNNPDSMIATQLLTNETIQIIFPIPLTIIKHVQIKNLARKYEPFQFRACP